ncbi:hypothetical protein Sango_2868400 [Sesamum angolense]|uniref:Uncharacterized protein n=1 Tax=Sesamum angolense TaxID=2727404 RepID=A0AAE1T6J2_9LAMI|nr:hypothetical protein Sango_2868400 [Sesamum angolense]
MHSRGAKRKNLGYLIPCRGIEANPKKIKAIQDMSPLTTKKEVQKLTGRIAALSRFLSRGAETGLPFFKILKNVEETGIIFDSGSKEASPLLSVSSSDSVDKSASEAYSGSPNASGRMTKWAVELSEHGIEFEERPAKKAQALADFILEVTGNEDSTRSLEWEIFVDGSSTSSRSKVGIVIKSPQIDYIEYAITLEFPASNMKKSTKLSC